MLGTLQRYGKTFTENLGRSDEPLKVFSPKAVGGQTKLIEVDRPPIGAEKYIGKTAQWFDSPVKYASVPGAVIGNAVLGNPVGGLSDAILGTNFKPDPLPSVESVPRATAIPQTYRPVSSGQLEAALPPLSADDLRRQVDYFRRRIRTDLETLKTLEQQKYDANLFGSQ